MQANPHPHRPSSDLRTGASLVEVMIAILILAVIALAGAAFLEHGEASVRIEKNRRAALGLAEARLEALRSSDFASISPPAKNYNTYYLEEQGGDWEITAGNPGEQLVINGRDVPMETTLQYEDVDGGPASYDMVRIRVQTGYRPGSNDRVTLETLVGP